MSQHRHLIPGHDSNSATSPAGDCNRTDPRRFSDSRLRYPSDLTERAWRRIALLLPPDRPLGRKRTTDLREVVNGIHYRWVTGCAWRMLPHDFPPWATVYAYFQRWCRNGTLLRLRESLLRPRDERDHSAGANLRRSPADRNPRRQRNDADLGTNPKPMGHAPQEHELAEAVVAPGCAEGRIAPRGRFSVS